MPSQMIAMTVFVFALAQPLSPDAEFIEPTRNLQSTMNAPGDLTVLSEPPHLEINLDDIRVGKTPAFIKKVKSGIHRLRVEDSETELYLEPGETLQISLFKGEFINVPIAEKKPIKQQALKEKQVNENPTIQQPLKEEQKNDLTPLGKVH